MNILFITPSYKPAYIYGGPTVSVSELAEALATAGHSVTIYTTTANGKEELPVKTNVPLIIDGVTVYYFKRQTKDHTHISIGLWKKLWNTGSQYDVIHVQSWWSLLNFGAAAICRAKNRRYIISPRGMLSWYSFQQQHSALKKGLHQLFGRLLLRKSILHATTSLEWRDCLKVNPNWKGFVLPNLVRFPDTISSSERDVQSSPIVFGFLSRIDHKKGLELLFEALSNVGFDYRLKIAGKGEETYIGNLQELASQLGISDKIEWCGWKTGDDKFVFLSGIDVFMLTSYNENFANTVLEALVSGTPVFISRGVGLADYVEANSLGWLCDADVGSIQKGLELVYKQRYELSIIKQRAPKQVRQDFDKQHLAEQYARCYQQFV